MGIETATNGSTQTNNNNIIVITIFVIVAVWLFSCFGFSLLVSQSMYV